MAGSVADVDRRPWVIDVPPRVEPSHPVTWRMMALLVAIAVLALGLLSIDAVTLVTVPADTPQVALRLAGAIAITALAHFARIRLMIGRQRIGLVWAELSLVVALLLIPVAWVPLAAAAGSLIGHARLIAQADGEARRRGLYSLVVYILAACVGVGGALIWFPRQSPAAFVPGHPVAIFFILLAALLYFAVVSVCAAAWFAFADDQPFRAYVRVSLRVRGWLLLANLAVALACVVVVAVNPWWLALLVPVLLGLHLLYAFQSRVDQDRRIWATLADATRELHQLDEAAVQEAALRGAALLFNPERVEMTLAREPGSSLLLRLPIEALAVAKVVARRLRVGGTDIGNLALGFRRRSALTRSEQDAFVTYADAVASALHDAATHRHLRAMTARSAFEAGHEPLTGLSNRSTLMARGSAVVQSLQPSHPVALILFDVDGFRQVNDALGHDGGDDLLRVIAGRLVAAWEDGELLGHLGGDEFVLFVPEPGDRSIADLVARATDIATALAVPVEIAGVSIAAESSAGVAVELAGDCDLTELLRRSGAALRQARREGLRVAPYDPATDPGSDDRLSLLADLRDALATTDQLVLRLQPIVNLRTGKPIGVEALVYWQHPVRGLLAPKEYRSVVDQSEMSIGLSQHAMALALAAAAQWRADGLVLPVSVKICARCTVNPELPRMVAAMLADYGVPPTELVIEVSESVMNAEVDQVERVITGLRAVGVQVAVDDFGAASASLAFLARFPVDEVKIDHSFVAGMADSPEATAIVRATVDLARQLRLRVVADGVERDEQRITLAALGVAGAQGELFYPPMAPAAAAVVVRAALGG